MKGGCRKKSTCQGSPCDESCRVFMPASSSSGAIDATMYINAARRKDAGPMVCFCLS